MPVLGDGTKGDFNAIIVVCAHPLRHMMRSGRRPARRKRIGQWCKMCESC